MIQFAPLCDNLGPQISLFPNIMETRIVNIVLREKKSKEIFLPILLCVGPSCLAPSCVLRGISGWHKFNATNKFVCVAKVWFTKVCMFVVALRSVFAQKYPVLVTLAMSNLPSSAFLSSLSPPRRSISSRTRTCDTGGRVMPLPSGGWHGKCPSWHSLQCYLRDTGTRRLVHRYTPVKNISMQFWE